MFCGGNETYTPVQLLELDQSRSVDGHRVVTVDFTSEGDIPELFLSIRAGPPDSAGLGQEKGMVVAASNSFDGLMIAGRWATDPGWHEDFVVYRADTKLALAITPESIQTVIHV